MHFGVPTLCSLVYRPCALWSTDPVHFGAPSLYILKFLPCALWKGEDRNYSAVCTYQDLRCTDQNDPGGGIHHQQVLLRQGYKLKKKKKHNTKSVFMNETATSAVSLKSVVNSCIKHFGSVPFCFTNSGLLNNVNTLFHQRSSIWFLSDNSSVSFLDKAHVLKCPVLSKHWYLKGVQIGNQL